MIGGWGDRREREPRHEGGCARLSLSWIMTTTSRHQASL
jgi:hypothetical protein